MAMSSVRAAAFSGGGGYSHSRRQTFSRRSLNTFVRRFTDNRGRDGRGEKISSDLGGSTDRISYVKPPELDKLCKELPFTRYEIKLMYHEFKKECPAGEMSEKEFSSIYSRFFAPDVLAGRYAKHLFRVMVAGKQDFLTFDVFMRNLMIVERRSIKDKFQFLFSLYDVKNDGVITKDEVSEVVQSVYNLAGWKGSYNKCINDHISEVFKKFDQNGDGQVSKEEFVYTCMNDEIMMSSMSSLRTE